MSQRLRRARESRQAADAEGRSGSRRGRRLPRSSPSRRGDLDPTEYAILDGHGSTAQELVALEADDIVLNGFVLQGAFQPDYLDVVTTNPRLLRRAINSSDAYSGYRIRHNLIRDNTVGIQFGSRGTTESRFDHNCLRENVWGLAADGRALIDARIDHNATFRNEIIAFEPAPRRDAVRRVGVENVTFDDNRSQQDGRSYLIRNSTASRIVHNEVTDAAAGARSSSTARTGICCSAGIMSLAGARVCSRARMSSSPATWSIH